MICNGFFEWKKEGKSSKPYFIHAEQEDNVLIDDPTTWNLEFDSPIESNGFIPLKLAALFEKQIKEVGWRQMVVLVCLQVISHFKF